MMNITKMSTAFLLSAILIGVTFTLSIRDIHPAYAHVVGGTDPEPGPYPVAGAEATHICPGTEILVNPRFDVGGVGSFAGWTVDDWFLGVPMLTNGGSAFQVDTDIDGSDSLSQTFPPTMIGCFIYHAEASALATWKTTVTYTDGSTTVSSFTHPADGLYHDVSPAFDPTKFAVMITVEQVAGPFGPNCLDNFSITSVPIKAEKFYTDTNKEVDPILDDAGTPDDPTDDFLRPRTVEEASLGTPLPKDPSTDKFLLEAVVKKDGTVSSYNPGQYYAVTKVNVVEDLDMLWIFEFFVDCTETTMISVVNPDNPDNPEKVPRKIIGPATGTLEVVLIRDGLVFDISSDIAASGGLILSDSFPAGAPNGVIDNAEAHLEDLKKGDMILFYVKFGPGLKGKLFPEPDPMCENMEIVKAMADGLGFGTEVSAGLIVRPK